MSIRIIKSVLLLLIGFSNLKASAEITNGIVNVYHKSKTQIAFKLFDNVKIECGDPEGKWLSIVIFLPSKKEFYKPNLKLKKGYSLIDSTGKKIGYVVSDSIDVTPLYSKHNNLYQLRFAGYIKAIDVRPSSILETELQNLFNSSSTDLSYNSFKKFIADFKLRHYKTEIDESYPSNNSYVLWYDPYVVSNAVLRVQLIFDKDKLVAILHSRKLKITRFKDIKLERNYLLWIKNNDEKELANFIKTYRKIHEVRD
jgi:hypothetical protein